MKLKWKRDEGSIITRYTSEGMGYRFAIAAANSRCWVMAIGPDRFGPYPNMKTAKAEADRALELIAENEARKVAP